MDIRNKNMQEIGEIMKEYLTEFFDGCKIITQDNNLFTESYQLEFWEIKDNLPEKHRSAFEDETIINNASGFIEFEVHNIKFSKNEYTAILLSNEDYSEALILLAQETDNDTGESDIITVKDFMTKEE